MELEQLQSYVNFKLGEISTWKYMAEALDAAVEARTTVKAKEDEIAVLDSQIEQKHEALAGLDAAHALRLEELESELDASREKSMATLSAAVDRAEKYQVNVSEDIKRLEMQQKALILSIENANVELQDTLKELGIVQVDYKAVLDKMADLKARL
jgi:seryl-tRNA synthetase